MTKIKEKIVLIGGGGHAKVVIDAIRVSDKFSIYGIVDPHLKEGLTVLGIKVIGSDNILPDVFKKGIKRAFIGVGSVGDCKIRKDIYKTLKLIGFGLPVIIHPGSIVADSVDFGEGTFVAAGAVINPGSRIGKNVIINTNSSIDHDCELKDFVHIAPGVTLSGGVTVGEETHIGTGAIVIQYISIGKKCLIGAGSTLCRNVNDNTRPYEIAVGSNEKE